MGAILEPRPTITGHLDGAETKPAPSIQCWIPRRDPTGAALLIFPGGGYGSLAEHEGSAYAEYFSRAGIACFVVKYRLGSEGYRHPAMLEDALAAIHEVRSRAEEFHVHAQKIGVVGSSAGGHLAAHTLVDWKRGAPSVSTRPDFGILCYPVISMTESFRHQGSAKHLAGEDAPPELLEELSCEKRVTPHTPPCFLWHSDEDKAVPAENSLAFALALRRNAVPAELHLYRTGTHGMGLNAPDPWGEACLRWLAGILDG